MKTILIEGAAIKDITSFYTEINRVFMGGVGWQLGHSLDALDDMLYGGYGAIQGKEPVQLIWRDVDRNRADLGVEATRRHYLAKLERPDLYNADFATQKLAELDKGTGETFFDSVLSIIADHPNIQLVTR